MFEFSLQASEGAARSGVFETPHGGVLTPTFMPVGTQGTVKSLIMEEVDALGAQVVLANTYHLYLRPGHDPVARLGGLGVQIARTVGGREERDRGDDDFVALPNAGGETRRVQCRGAARDRDDATRRHLGRERLLETLDRRSRREVAAAEDLYHRFDIVGVDRLMPVGQEFRIRHGSSSLQLAPPGCPPAKCIDADRRRGGCDKSLPTAWKKGSTR